MQPFNPMMSAIQDALTPDLLRPQWRGRAHPHAGHCYAAAEAMYHALRAHGVRTVPHVGRCVGGTHWWLRLLDADGTYGAIVDPTAQQFDHVERAEVYRTGRPCGFLTVLPSARAQKILERAGIRVRTVTAYEKYEETGDERLRTVM